MSIRDIRCTGFRVLDYKNSKFFESLIAQHFTDGVIFISGEKFLILLLEEIYWELMIRSLLTWLIMEKSVRTLNRNFVHCLSYHLGHPPPDC